MNCIKEEEEEARRRSNGSYIKCRAMTWFWSKLRVLLK